MTTSYEATAVITDDIAHKVNPGGKRIGYITKTKGKETPPTVVDTDGPSGNVKALGGDIKKMCLVHIRKNLPVGKKVELLATLIAMKLKGEIWRRWPAYGANYRQYVSDRTVRWAKRILIWAEVRK